jgi:chromosome transmission fidelity protein 1
MLAIRGLARRREPRTTAEVEAVLQQYSECIEQGKGAVMLSVVGGKLSEGINFQDGLGRWAGCCAPAPAAARVSLGSRQPRDKVLALASRQGAGRCRALARPPGLPPACRCVVVLGMPYPNPSDPELQERMCFLDAASKAGQPGISGREYYDNLCMNAVNQCVGRVIRHAGDYAAIVLADARYAQQRASGLSPVQKLPKWIQASFSGTGGDFGAAFSQLKGFFRRHEQRQQQAPGEG